MNDLGALDAIVLRELLDDERVIYMHTHPPREWIEKVGRERVRTCAISEAAMVGMAVGAAMRGLRPVVDLNRASFMLCAMDQICNHAAKIQYLSGGQYTVPLTITCALRGDYHVDVGREHAPYAMFLNVPGLTVVVPGSLPDATVLLRASMRYDGPVLFFVSPLVAAGDSTPAWQPLSIGQARVARPGDDVTLIAIGAAMLIAMDVARQFERDGVSVEVIDPLTLAPLDIGSLRRSVRKTGRLVLVEEASGDATATMGIAARLLADAGTFAALRAAPQLVLGQPVPMPSALAKEEAVLPSADQLRAAVERSLRAAR